MSKIQPVVTRWKNTIRKERTYDLLSILLIRENGNGTKKYSEKATYKKKKKNVWLSGHLHIEGRLNEGPRLQLKHRDENEAKQNIYHSDRILANNYC